MQRQHDLLNRVAELIDTGVLHTTLGEHFGRIDAANLRRARCWKASVPRARSCWKAGNTGGSRAPWGQIPFPREGI